MLLNGATNPAPLQAQFAHPTPIATLLSPSLPDIADLQEKKMPHIKKWEKILDLEMVKDSKMELQQVHYATISKTFLKE